MPINSDSDLSSNQNQNPTPTPTPNSDTNTQTTITTPSPPTFISGDPVRAIRDIPSYKGVIKKGSFGTVQYKTWDSEHNSLLAIAWRSMNRFGIRDGDEWEILTVFPNEVEKVETWSRRDG